MQVTGSSTINFDPNSKIPILKQLKNYPKFKVPLPITPESPLLKTKLIYYPPLKIGNLFIQILQRRDKLIPLKNQTPLKSYAIVYIDPNSSYDKENIIFAQKETMDENVMKIFDLALLGKKLTTEMINKEMARRMMKQEIGQKLKLQLPDDKNEIKTPKSE